MKEAERAELRVGVDESCGGIDGVLWQTHNEGVPFCIEETIADGESGVGLPLLLSLMRLGRGCTVLVSDLAERRIV